MKRNRFDLACTVLLLLGGLGCDGGEIAGPADGVHQGDSAEDAGSCAPTLASVSAMLSASCTASGCHSSAYPAGGLDLGAGDLATRLVGQSAGTCDGWQLVSPGRPESSLLVKKLVGDVPMDCGDPMPPTGQHLSATQIGCIQGWIAELAVDAAVSDPVSCETCGTSSCVDTDTDLLHCGTCSNACPSGASCSSGTCTCPAGFELCGGRCVDVSRDAAHCGSCGKSCGTGSVCTNGACACSDGLDSCGGACVELASDPENCSGCGVVCGPGKFCTPTGCGTQVDCTGLTKCGSSCVDTKTSLLNCGGCGVTCKAGESCNNGVCGCAGGAVSCNGSCTSVVDDAANCGACGNVCPTGTSCENGACACPGGGSSCGGACIDTSSDLENCGACGHACAPGQTCQAGHCACSDRVVDFTKDVAPILQSACTNAGCHSGTKPKENLSLSSSTSYAELVGVKTSQCNDGRLLVKPGDPGTSYLMQKLLGQDLCSGTQMPKAGSSLPAQQLETITAWICQGAAK
ncbi:MAG: hypothetical protein QM778_16745 [Myxococcales bacterium]